MDADVPRSVNAWASCLEPGDIRRHRCPDDPLELDDSVVGGDAATVGRGWDYGVGMVQWGAYGKALRGLPGPRTSSPTTTRNCGPEPYPEPGVLD